MRRARHFPLPAAVAVALGAACFVHPLCLANPGFELAANRRVDLVMLGDSNQLFGTHGWEDAFSQLLDQRYGLYATGLHSLGENDGNSAGSGWIAGTLESRSRGGVGYSGAAPSVDRLLPASALCAPLNYARVVAGTSTGTSLGIVLRSSQGFDVQRELRGLVATSAEPGTTFPFSLSFRQEYPPFAILAQSGPLTPSGEDGRLRWHEFMLPPGPRPGPISLRAPAFGDELRGPWTGFYARVIDDSKTQGISVHTLYGRGGQTLRSMAEALRAMGEPALGEYFAAIRAQQQQPSPHIILRINSGVNDRSEGRPSLGPASVADGASADAFVDNAVAIIDTILDVWTARGWDQSELRFVLSVSHPVSVPNDSALTAYANAITRLPPMYAPNLVSTVALESLIGADAMAANAYYAGAFDRFHLSRSGYLELASRELHALRGCNTIDFNNNGLFPEDDDLIDFLAVLAGGPCSTGDCNAIDFNNDGLFPADEDLLAYLRVLAGGDC